MRRGRKLLGSAAARRVAEDPGSPYVAAAIMHNLTLEIPTIAHPRPLLEEVYVRIASEGTARLFTLKGADAICPGGRRWRTSMSVYSALTGPRSFAMMPSRGGHPGPLQMRLTPQPGGVDGDEHLEALAQSASTSSAFRRRRSTQTIEQLNGRFPAGSAHGPLETHGRGVTLRSPRLRAQPLPPRSRLSRDLARILQVSGRTAGSAGRSAHDGNGDRRIPRSRIS